MLWLVAVTGLLTLTFYNTKSSMVFAAAAGLCGKRAAQQASRALSGVVRVLSKLAAVPGRRMACTGSSPWQKEGLQGCLQVVSCGCTYRLQHAAAEVAW